jgi:hypothetical protein
VVRRATGKATVPTVLWIEGHRFYFYSGEEGEPPHIHVEHGDKLAKYWLEPIALASAKRFRSHELNRVQRLVEAHRAEFLEAWHEHFHPRN